MKQWLIVGVDVSKKTLDIFIRPSDLGFKIENSPSGFQQLHQRLSSLGCGSQAVMIVMEHTGMYSRLFEKFLHENKLPFSKVPALQIKRSIGMVRGKEDSIDAYRIAEYGWLRKDTLKPTEPVSPLIEQLNRLLQLRVKLVGDRAGYLCSAKEAKSAGFTLKADPTGKILKQTIDLLSRQITATEKQIQKLIESNESIKKNCQLLMSIVGVGLIISASTMAVSANFTRFASARKFNCYSGLAPFKHQSGTSIKGRTRVSHLANKGIKTLLNMAASAAIQHDQELKNYYQRRVAEGKSKMSCLNIVRGKIVSRMFAVIKRQTPFVKLQTIPE